ncbi:alkaline phytoceramidase [Rozella allomycis CSF55]|uniref:Alkaline phytoceramidase n=1 Tax=Rozella allomycis (strain CSF55) TaxID=988480 RepID=A0A4P9YN00_ROZAC|nr:alkaline phytoceramidase [Rozella allomycis CSF55]
MANNRTQNCLNYHWGCPTATIDWCERNYDTFSMIAEFFNTVSNLPYIVFGLLGIYNIFHYQLKKRFTISYIAVCFVGLGSLLFHLTLNHTMQMLDEIPMIYAASIFLYHNLQLISDFKKSRLACYALSLLCVLFTYFHMVFNLPIIQHIVYALLVLYVFYSRFVVIKSTENVEKKEFLMLLFKRSMALFLTGFLFWNVDNLMCDHLISFRDLLRQNGLQQFTFLFQFHAIWHILTCLGTFHEICAAFISSDETNENIVYYCCFVPLMGPQVPQRL